MQEQLNIAIIQSDLIWEHPEQNRLNFSSKITGIKDDVDVVLLPEMFTSGFTMNPEHVAETMTGDSVNAMKKWARENNTTIGGSLVIEENGAYYNRFVFVTPDGKIETYDKRHTFTLAGEHKVYQSGQEKVIVDYNGWKLCLQICYDLRFPVWSRNSEGYDVLIYVANWPKPRITAWDTLLKARAIENMCYCIGVNRVGLDANANEYVGHSAVYDALGERISEEAHAIEVVQVVSLNKSHIMATRETLKFLEDQDKFTLLTT